MFSTKHKLCCLCMSTQIQVKVKNLSLWQTWTVVCWKAYTVVHNTCTKPVSYSLHSAQTPGSSETSYHRRTAEHFGVTAPNCHPGMHGHRQSPTHHLLEPRRQQAYWCLQHQSAGERQPHYHRHQAAARRSLFVPSHHSWHTQLYHGFS